MFLRSVTVAVLLSSCATAPAVYPTPSSSFNASEVTWFEADGGGSITGSAVLRTRGGDVKTCAGYPVGLIPVSTYATEIMTSTFGQSSRGFAPSYALRKLEAVDDYFRRMQRKSTCDAQGYFTFSNLPSGDYYVVTGIQWEVPGRYISSMQGGVLMQRVWLGENEKRTIVLTTD